MEDLKQGQLTDLYINGQSEKVDHAEVQLKGDFSWTQEAVIWINYLFKSIYNSFS